MSKDTMISFRISSELATALTEAARAKSEHLGVPVSRSQYVELAVKTYLEHDQT